MSQRADAARTVSCVGLIGPMKTAWKQIFQDGLEGLEGPAPLLVIVWHSEWMRPGCNLWKDLSNELSTTKNILVVIFGDTPDDLGEEKHGKPLGVLLRAIAEDSRPLDSATAARGGGWVSISDFRAFSSASSLWEPKSGNDSTLVRLCQVCAELNDNGPTVEAVTSEVPKPTLEEFFQFLDFPMSFRARKLHAAKKDDREAVKRGLHALKWLASRVFLPQTLSLNILMVENAPQDLPLQIQGAPWSKERDNPLDFFSETRFHLIRANFDDLKKPKDELASLSARVVSFKNGRLEEEAAAPIPWDDLDLVLQDIVLDRDHAELGGLKLAPHYFEACPQALVFLLTSLDVESLVGSGDVDWRYVDCIVAKEALPSLWYEYRRCFQERFGRMFWPDWTKLATDRDRPTRELLRKMFASLRRWQIEPDILWHGQTLPEMIDHAHRHVTALWRLVNDYVGTLIENGGADRSILNLDHRVALALAVWMHDVGHRGDEYLTDSIQIRANHAGISDRLLLRNPDGYGLGWLRERVPLTSCRNPGQEGRDARLECRNRPSCSEDGSALCLLRQVGLLCRHHQSNAPLDDKLPKVPSLYSRIPATGADNGRGESFLKATIDEALTTLAPRSTGVRLLSDFVLPDSTGFRTVVGLLRMLDALQLHRARVGSVASIASFVDYLENRDLWCNSELHNLCAHRNATTRGTPERLRLRTDLRLARKYKKILTSQDLHYWRQAAVHDSHVVWRWEPEGKAFVDVAFVFNERTLQELGNMPRIKDIHEDATAKNSGHPLFSNAHGSAILKWIKNVREDEIEKEDVSQHKGRPAGVLGYLGVLAPHVTFRVVVRDTDQKVLEGELPHPIFAKAARIETNKAG